MTRIGCTGHQAMSAETRRAVAAAIATRLAQVDGKLIGVCSLALGADQVFAYSVLAAGGAVHSVIPSSGYHTTFDDGPEREAYGALAALASQQLILPFSIPGEEAFLAAGHEVADNCDILIAVWDGLPATGVGGTADVVKYAMERGTPVEVIWPDGSRRQ
jgi:hypothetical protein